MLRISEKNVKFVFLLPAVIWAWIFVIFPLVYSLRLGFCSSTLGGEVIFVGLENFFEMFQDYRFWNSLTLTLVFVLIAVSSEFLVGLGLALFFNREIKGRRFFRALLTLPMFATPLAVGYLGITILSVDSGPINNILVHLGFGGVKWLSDSNFALISIILTDIWQWTPFCFIILLAGLQALPGELYEAASLDTTSGFQLFRYITLPLLIPVIIITVFLRLIESFKTFGMVFSLTSGGPAIATEVFSLFTYRTGLKYFNFGYASSLAYFLLLIVMIPVIIFFKAIRESYK